MPPNPIIDMHTHMFNGFYVPMEEIFNHKFGIPRPIAISLGIIFKAAIGETLTDPWEEDEGWLKMADQPDATDLLADTVFDVIIMKLQNELLSWDIKEVKSKQDRSDLSAAWSMQMPPMRFLISRGGF